MGGLLGGWGLRGIYADLFLLENRFQLVNASEQERELRVKFPSGESFTASLDAGGSVEFEIRDTGEGSITVLERGQQLGSAGYVTTSNPLTIISVTQKTVYTTQVFP